MVHGTPILSSFRFLIFIFSYKDWAWGFIRAKTGRPPLPSCSFKIQDDIFEPLHICTGMSSQRGDLKRPKSWYICRKLRRYDSPVLTFDEWPMVFFFGCLWHLAILLLFFQVRQGMNLIFPEDFRIYPKQIFAIWLASIVLCWISSLWY